MRHARNQQSTLNEEEEENTLNTNQNLLYNETSWLPCEMA